MKVLLDECLPRRLKRAIPGHQVATVPEVGWAGRSNGELLALASAEYDVFVTIDRNLAAQTPVGAAKIGLIVLRARSSRFADLEPLVPDILKALESIQPGQIVTVGG